MSATRIINYEHFLKPEHLKFNQSVHPQIKNIEEHVEWFMYQSPLNPAPDFLLGFWTVTEEGNVVAHYPAYEIRWHYKGKERQGFIGFDHHVHPDYRHKGLGGWLLLRMIKKYRPFFGMGLTDAVKPLYESARVPAVGYNMKYLWLNRPVKAVQHFLEKRLGKINTLPAAAPEPPKKIVSGGTTFSLMTGFPFNSYKPYYEEDVIELSRSADFLKWRFFDSYRKYYFYYGEFQSRSMYFILRNVQYKGLNLLLIADFKFPLGEAQAGKIFFNSVKAIAKALKVDGIITISSYSVFDQRLKESGFFAIGKPAPVVSTVYKYAEDIPKDTKPPIHITMADSDLDLTFGDQ